MAEDFRRSCYFFPFSLYFFIAIAVVVVFEIIKGTLFSLGGFVWRFIVVR